MHMKEDLGTAHMAVRLEEILPSVVPLFGIGPSKLRSRKLEDHGISDGKFGKCHLENCRKNVVREDVGGCKISRSV